MEDWMREALTEFLEANWAAFEQHLKDTDWQGDDPAGEIMDELRPRK